MPNSKYSSDQPFQRYASIFLVAFLRNKIQAGDRGLTFNGFHDGGNFAIYVWLTFSCFRSLKLLLDPVSVAEVERLLSRLVPTKTPGPDTIRPSELKLVAKVLAPTVTILFNESLATGELPQEFKAGNLSPLLKPGKTDTALPANCRGMTLTSILSKVLEKIVCNQITSYLDQSGTLHESQYGFRKGRSCSDLLVK